MQLVGFALALALLIGVAWVNVRQGAAAQVAAGWVTHTERVRDALGAVLTGVLDAETSMRGFALTGDAEFLAPYEAGRQAAPAQLRRARELTADNPGQQRKLAALEPLLASKLEHCARVVQLRRAAGFAAAQAEVASGRGKVLMDAVRAGVAELDAVEARLLAERAATTERAAATAREMTLLCSGLSVVLFVGVFALMLRENRLRREANLALRASEENLSVTLQSIGDGVLATDTAGRVTQLNAVAETLTGWKQAGAAGRPVAEVFQIIHETTRQPAFLPVADTLAKGTIHGLANHTVLIARDGTERPIADSCAPIRDRAGAVLGAVLVFRDVTEQRRATLKLDQLHRQQELIFNAVADGLHGLNLDGTINFQNPAAERMLGFSNGEVLGKPAHLTVHHHRADGAEYPVDQCPIYATLRDGETRTVRDEVFWRKDGTSFGVEYVVSGINDEQGRRIGAIVAFRDVTEHQRQEEELRRAHEELTRANNELGNASRHKDQFLANMSHELRTPLNAILGMSELLTEQLFGPLTPRQAKFVTTISSSGQHLLALINDILDLSKIEAGKLSLLVEPLPVEEFCQSCLAFVRTQAMQKHIGVDYEHDGRLTTFPADSKRFKQILVNLLTNAVKFTPYGGRIGLTVAAPEGEGVVRFTVWDTGIGIAPADAAKLFKAFTQVDSGLNRTQEGTGLGLALVAKLVELHGGSVTLESEPWKGSRFIVTLPATLGSAAVPPPEVGGAPNSPGTPPGGHSTGLEQPSRRPDGDDRTRAARAPQTFRRALIIEDDPTAGEHLAYYLTELGLTSVVHTHGEESVAAVLRERPDLILLDILLPNESGWVVLARLKEHPHTRDIPVVVISVVDEPEKSLAMGAAAHFTKPVKRDELAALLQRPSRQKAPPPPRAAPPVLGTGPLILLAEDNEANIQTLGSYLQAQGYNMHYAMNGFAAVKLTGELRPALILMDIQMPVMDGLAAIRELRADAQFQDTPIIALTALAMSGDRERCLAAGATDYMSKPVKLKELAALVEKLLPRTGESGGI